MTDRKLEFVDSESALRALAAFAAADRAERDPPSNVSTERLLYEAGFSYAQIGVIVGGKADTVRKRLERSGKDEQGGRKARSD